MKLVSFVLPLCSILCAVVADIIKPYPHEEWVAGTIQTVEIQGDFQADDTVAIFFDKDRNALLGGGPAIQRFFEIKVPWEAVSPPGKFSELIIVHRYQYNLTNVETVWVNVTDHK